MVYKKILNFFKTFKTLIRPFLFTLKIIFNKNWNKIYQMMKKNPYH
jgi:hypothetical protein